MLSSLRRLYRWLLQRKRRSYIDSLVRNGLRIGKDCEIHDGFFFDPSHCFLISIGDNCELAPNVRLIAHDASSKRAVGYAKIGRVEIGNSCFLGDSVIVLPGVTIGENSIIGAGAVVTRNIPPNTVAAGNPARVLGSVNAYADRIRTHSSARKIFGLEYYLEHLDDNKRAEVLAAVADGVAYIL